MKPKEFLTSLLILSGLLLLCCEADTLAVKAVTVLCSFALWGAAWLCWQGLDRALYLARKTAHCLREALKEEVRAGEVKAREERAA